ncbi:hypothetical protein H6P81_018235 [Aristolochia fimbriata]|uniref:Aminotransferase-like plant mobile domain-containing protein n=1 Tax=Aristolochia fimbriata TaxID=158543 RepID=A0AAV7E3M8_ARIFI|nr:hypothetical protein H6P81_018235 [Aristolochia fimbriata]
MHGEDLEGVRRPGMISFGNPSLRHTFDEEQARDLFRCLPVLVWNHYILGASTIFGLVDEPKAPISSLAYESLLNVCCCYLMVHRCIRLFIEPYNPIRFARQFGYCQDLPGDLGANTSQRETSSLSELLNLWEVSLIRPCGQLDLPLRGESSRDPGTTFAYYSWWKEHMLPRFEGVVEKRRVMIAIVPICADDD